MILSSLMPVLALDDAHAFEYLKLAVSSFMEYHAPWNKLVIHLDGPNKEIGDWLDGQGFSYTQSQWMGATRTLDRMIREADTEYVIPVSDDIVFSPGWDTNLMEWMVEENKIINPHLISHGPPRPRGYKKEDTYFGTTAEEFERELFLEYVE